MLVPGEAPAAAAAAVASKPAPLGYSDTVREMSNSIQALEDYGLRLTEPAAMSADAVEQVLITDEWSCDECGLSNVAVCPVSGKPHRRRLVRIAQDILRLVGRRVGKTYLRSARLADRMDGNVRVRTERHMAMNPQLLLLAFYFASETGDDGFVPECARHLLDLLKQVENYGRRLTSGMDEDYSRALLRSFHSAWKEYLKHATGEVAANDPAAKRVSSAELFDGTRSALLAAAAEMAREPANVELKAFAALLFQRVQRLATKEQLDAVKAELAEIESAGPTPRSQPGTPAGGPSSSTGTGTGPSRSPTRLEPSNPPLMPSDLNNTSGSEADALPPDAAARALGYVAGKPRHGPSLPPDWHVDDEGRSRPRPGHEERKRRERYLQLEFRARKAYEAVMSVDPPRTEVDQQREAVAGAIGEAQLAELARQVNLPRPRFAMIPELLRVVQEGLLEALPRRFRPQLEQEFRDALDWNVIVARAANGQAGLSNVLTFVMHKVLLYGAPEREATIRVETARASADLDAVVPNLGTAVASAFRCLFAAIRTLREDVSRYSLLLVANELRSNALEYIRAAIDGCLPPPAQWASSVQFLRQFVNQAAVREWVASPEAAPTLSLLTPPERRVRGALFFGLVDLLRSGAHTTSNRWNQLPAEIFYQEKALIFSAANAVQECTLLLLLEGTVSTILASKRCTHAQVAETLRRLHAHILALLGTDTKVNSLKVAVADFLDDALERLFGPTDGSTTAALAAVPQLSEVERRVVAATIDKMTDTESPLYASFEAKVILLITRFMRNEPNPPPLGLVTEAARSQAALLAKMLAFNWEVYRPYIQTLIPLLNIEE